MPKQSRRASASARSSPNSIGAGGKARCGPCPRRTSSCSPRIAAPPRACCCRCCTSKLATCKHASSCCPPITMFATRRRWRARCATRRRRSATDRDELYLLGIGPDEADPELGYILPEHQRRRERSARRAVRREAADYSRALADRARRAVERFHPRRVGARVRSPVRAALPGHRRGDARASCGTTATDPQIPLAASRSVRPTARARLLAPRARRRRSSRCVYCRCRRAAGAISARRSASPKHCAASSSAKSVPYPSLDPTAHLSLAAQHARLQMAM